MTTTTKIISAKALQIAAEGKELNKKPVVYVWGGRIEKLDSGPESGIYDKNP